MKFIKYILIFLLAINILIACAVNVVAEKINELTDENIERKELTDKDIDRVIENIEFKYLTEKPLLDKVESFDVNSSGMIAVGHNSFPSTRLVCVYTSDGQFQYGYEFKNSGFFHIEWDDDNLVIYLVRSDYVIIVDSKGNIIEMYDIIYTSEFNRYLNKLSAKRTCKVEDTEYILKSDNFLWNIFAPRSQIVAVNSQGERQIVYDATLQQLPKTLVLYAFILFMISSAIIQFYRIYRIFKKSDSIAVKKTVEDNQ